MFRPNRAEASTKQGSKLNFFGKIFSTKRGSPSPPSHNDNQGATNKSAPRKKSPGFIQSDRGNFDKKLYQEYCKH